MRLKGHIAIVTGAGRGIGRSIARAYASEGASIVATARTVSELEYLVHEIRRSGGVALSVPGSVINRADVTRVVETTVKEFGHVDILVNNAGIPGSTKDLYEMSESEWDEVMEVNVKGIFHFTSLVLPYMLKQHSGNIVNISSGAGEKHELARYVRSVPYNVSKFAVEGLNRNLASRLLGTGINVNAIRPEPVNTGFHSATPGEVLQKLTGKTGGLREPESVNPLAIYLAALRPGELTGESLSVSDWSKLHAHTG